MRVFTFLLKQAASLDSQELVAPVRWHVPGTSVHFFIQTFAGMLGVSILWQALRRVMGRWMWKQLTYNWVVCLTLGLKPRTVCVSQPGSLAVSEL